MTNPRPEIVRDMLSLATRHGCTDAELHAAVDALKRPSRKGRPKSEFYDPLEWAMFALVGIYRKRRFTAAKQILSLTNAPVEQRADRASTLVRRFNKRLKKGELPRVQEYYAQCGTDRLEEDFKYYWQLSGLLRPADLTLLSACRAQQGGS